MVIYDKTDNLIYEAYSYDAKENIFRLIHHNYNMDVGTIDYQSFVTFAQSYEINDFDRTMSGIKTMTESLKHNTGIKHMVIEMSAEDLFVELL